MTMNYVHHWRQTFFKHHYDVSYRYRCSSILDANGEPRSFRPRDRDEMVKQVIKSNRSLKTSPVKENKNQNLF